MFKSYLLHTFMLRHTVAYLLLLCMLPSCIESDVTTTQSNDGEQEIIYDLNDSTDIILALLKSDELSKILEDTDPEKLDMLIKNVSPALMAFESEVLACTLPVLVCYYVGEQKEQCKQWLLQLHEQHPNIKYVSVDVDKLFSVSQQSEVELTPTLLLIKDGQEKARFTPPVDLGAVRGALTQV